MKNVRDIIALVLAVTVSAVLLGTAAKLAFYSPSEIPNNSRESLENTISLLIGALVGYISGKQNPNQ